MNDAAGTPQPMAIAPGWYPDPHQRFELRYHNGTTWTADVASDGRRFVDPVGTSPDAPPAPGGDRNRLAVAAMVLGIVGLATSWLPFLFVLGAAAAVVAVVFGTIGLRRSRATGVGGGPATVGIVTGVAGIAATALGVALTVITLRAYDAYEYPEPHQIELTRCDVNEGVATAAGRITNLGDDTGSYTVDIAFVRPGTDNVQRSGRVDIDDLDPGASAEFELGRTVRLDAVECDVRSVKGPLPFGVDLGG